MATHASSLQGGFGASSSSSATHVGGDLGMASSHRFSEGGAMSCDGGGGDFVGLNVTNSSGCSMSEEFWGGYGEDDIGGAGGSTGEWEVGRRCTREHTHTTYSQVDTFDADKRPQPFVHRILSIYCHVLFELLLVEL